MGPSGGMADTYDSKSYDRKVMRVRLSPRALKYNFLILKSTAVGFQT